jgi:hypothetical protein
MDRHSILFFQAVYSITLRPRFITAPVPGATYGREEYRIAAFVKFSPLARNSFGTVENLSAADMPGEEVTTKIRSYGK